MDAVQAANSGHPGAPMGMADIAEVLWNDYLKHNPANPDWADRDRFVLSNGHASMLLYSLLHLTGYDLSMDEIRNFRQMGYRTAGHPEYEPGLGVETTTGPLGQGITNAVGMALAEKMLAEQFNRDGFDVVDHKTWVFLGDGCLMEGICHDSAAIAGAVDAAVAESERPTLICCKTVIGFGAPNKQGSASTHGAPLGPEEVEAARAELGWSYPPFEIPADIAEAWDGRDRGAADEAAWNERFAAYAEAHPELAGEFARRAAGKLPEDWADFADAAIAAIDAEAGEMATRKASLVALNAFAPKLPELAGGSADLTGSNLTRHAGSTPITGDDATGNYIYFGVREFGMTALSNGMALHGGVIPYSGTFLTFSDYARNALRMACLAPLRYRRDGRRLARRHRAPGRTDEPRPDAAGGAAPDTDGGADRRDRAGRLRPA